MNKYLEKIENSAILVGGAVRDELLDKKSNDLDYIVLNENEESMLSAGFIKVGSDFPVFLHPVTRDEYALARFERKTGKGYTGFSTTTENVSFKDDMSRRDLTINAMGKDKDGNILDPFNGKDDLKNKILRHTTEAFAEDPLRVLRLARFSAKLPDFTIAPETIELASSLRSEMSSLTKERVFKEFEKALSSEKPSNYFRALLEIGVLDIVHPEIFEMINIPQRYDYHAEGDVFEHTMRVLDECSLMTNNPIIRYASLYHDIGKASSFKERGNFHGHESSDLVNPLFDKLKEVERHPKIYVSMARKVAIHHTFVHGFESIKKAKSIVNRMMRGDFPSNQKELDILLMVSLADNFGRILGNRTLSFDETEAIFSGKKIEGFTKGKNPTYYENIRETFEAFSEKVKLPKEVIESEPSKIKEFIYLEKIRRVRLVKK